MSRIRVELILEQIRGPECYSGEHRCPPTFDCVIEEAERRGIDLSREFAVRAHPNVGYVEFFQEPYRVEITPLGVEALRAPAEAS